MKMTALAEVQLCGVPHVCHIQTNPQPMSCHIGRGYIIRWIGFGFHETNGSFTLLPIELRYTLVILSIMFY